MALSGSLEDLPIIDALQILGVSGKSGVLRVRTTDKQAEIGLQSGSIISASVKPRLRYIGDLLIERGDIDLSTLHDALQLQRQQGGDHKVIGAILLEMGAIKTERLEAAMRAHIQSIVNELASWVTGDFIFSLGDPEAVDDLRFLPEAVVRSMGLNPQELLLEAVRIYDEARQNQRKTLSQVLNEDDERANTVVDAVISEGPHADKNAEVILVTPNIYTRHLLRDAWHEKIASLHTPLTSDDASSLLLHTRLRQVLLLVDTDETSQTGAFSGGGVQVVEQLRKQWTDVPMVSFGSADDPATIERAAAAGVLQHVCVSIAERDGDAGTSGSFVAALELAVRAWAEDRIVGGTSQSEAEIEEVWLDRLYERMIQLRSDSQSSTVALEMLKFLASRLERAILFLVAGGDLHGLGAFGLPNGTPLVSHGARKLRLSINAESAVQRVLERRRLEVVTDASHDPTLSRLHAIIGVPVRPEALLVPLVVDEQPVSLVYADNGEHDTGVGMTGALGVLVEHAALLLENVLLRRKLGQGKVSDHG